jgi:cobalt-zinc-cadmium efflux system protein
VAHEHKHDHAHDHAHAHGEGHDDHAHDHHDHGHDHAHDHPGDTHADGAMHARDGKSASKLPWVLALTFTFFVVELVAASYANSNALRADAIHLLADVLAIAIAYTAFKLADRRPSARFTFGLRRIEAVAALVNALLVILGAAEIVHEGIESLHETAQPRTTIMLIVAGAALVVHGINATLLHRDLHGHGHTHASPHVHVGGAHGGHLHVRGAWLHVLGDALGAFVALVAAAAIALGAPRSVDPIASFVVAVLLVLAGLKLVKEATLVLLEAAPAHLPVEPVERAVSQVPGVECVHRLRVWTLGTGYDAIALHVTAKEGAGLSLAASVEKAIRAEFHVDYVCVQVDPPGAHDDAGEDLKR